MENLTIIIPSYNRGKYIEECLQSVFSQKTDYSYKIIVADDCSTDNTLDILEKYKDKITLLKSDKNRKLYKNVIRAYEITKTDYFTVLDPDDFWIDENFIQKSLDFLENNKDFVIYSTNAYKLENEIKTPLFGLNKPIISEFKNFPNVALGWTGATVFRNVIFKNGVPDKMINLEHPACEKSYRGDSFRNFIHFKYGKSYISPDFSAVYRITDTGIWMGKTKFEQDLLNARFFVDLYSYFDKKYPKFLLFAKNILKNTNFGDEYNELQAIFNNNKELLEKEALKDKKLKYRFYFWLYKKLYKKLKKKNIV